MTTAQQMKRRDLLDLKDATLDAVEHEFVKRLMPSKPMPYGIYDAEWLDALWWNYCTDRKRKKG